MYGTRGKIGLIVPSNNTVVEREFNRLLPEGYLVVATRMWNTQTEKGDLERMAAQAERGARELSTAEVDVVAFACTSGSFMNGPGWEAELQRRLQDAAGCPVVTTSSAFIGALHALDLYRVAVATPYTDDINHLERSYIEAHGFAVTDIRGLGIRDSVKIGQRSPEAARDLALSLDHSPADGIFISCTNFRTIDIIDELERLVSKPVVSSNQATFWKCIQTLGFEGSVSDAGRLLRDRLALAHA
jgi:maleate isomerase